MTSFFQARRSLWGSKHWFAAELRSWPVAANRGFVRWSRAEPPLWTNQHARKKPPAAAQADHKVRAEASSSMNHESGVSRTGSCRREALEKWRGNFRAGTHRGRATTTLRHFALDPSQKTQKMKSRDQGGTVMLEITTEARCSNGQERRRSPAPENARPRPQ